MAGLSDTLRVEGREHEARGGWDLFVEIAVHREMDNRGRRQVVPKHGISIRRNAEEEARLIRSQCLNGKRFASSGW